MNQEVIALPMARTERGQPPLARRTRPTGHNGKGKFAVFLYAAYCKGFAKIGIAEAPKVRVQSMQTGNPFPIELLGAVALSQADAVAAEQEALAALNDAHWFGDWFRCTRNHALFVLHEAAKGYQRTDLPLKGARQPPKPPPPPKVVDPKPVRFPRRCRPVVTPDGEFPSAASAAEHYGISRQAIHERVKAGRPGWSFRDRGAASAT